ncbi:OsmC family protein [Paraburkholderia youngii]|uniref:OsmC family protein n=1 Tax=Paraburkholderia youngii TaxID=2782701 RepID=UPI003D20894C
MPLATASARLAADAPNYLVALEAGRHALAGDEGPHEGGQDRGPAPFEFVLAGLAACTSATLRMYMQRKGWPDGAIDVTTTLHADQERNPVHSSHRQRGCAARRHATGSTRGDLRKDARHALHQARHAH